ncbi:NADP-dependent oxidoreductase [Pantoea sp. NPDC088449]|uniref:NADP-dependent oxidoreductase n=1 Tax=Pantoea sp. NPDC088449 TaxID=3364392 RepID=UPI0037F3C0C4
MQITGQQVVLASRPDGAPKAENFRLEKVTVRPPGEGEILLASRYLSLDPYMRGRMDDRKSYASPTPVDGVMEGEVIAEVIYSNHPDFTVGMHVLSRSGWSSHCVSNGDGLIPLDDRFKPITTALGVLGMPGLTAYTGLMNIGKPAPGETVVVAAASGPVGSLVGQIAKKAGARVVGIAGGKEKCQYVGETLGFDEVVDHRSPDFVSELAKACPNGIDVYLELVGGEVWNAVFPLLNPYARIPVCGLIAQYNANDSQKGTDRLPVLMREILSRSILFRGFIVREYWDQRPEFLDEVAPWVASGDVRFQEDIVFGLKNAPEAFMGLLEGKNFGKLIVQFD